MADEVSGEAPYEEPLRAKIMGAGACWSAGAFCLWQRQKIPVAMVKDRKQVAIFGGVWLALGVARLFWTHPEMVESPLAKK